MILDVQSKMLYIQSVEGDKSTSGAVVHCPTTSQHPRAGNMTDMDMQTNQGSEKKKVKIDVDNHPKHVAPGTYLVSAFKDLIGVPADKDLDQVIDGNLTTLADTASVTIVGD